LAAAGLDRQAVDVSGGQTQSPSQENTVRQPSTVTYPQPHWDSGHPRTPAAPAHATMMAGCCWWA